MRRLCPWLVAWTAVAVVVPGTGGAAQAAPPYTVSLSASTTALETAYYTALTTTTSRDLTGTTYTTYLFDQSDPTWYRTCKTAECTFEVTQFSAGTHTYMAYVAKETAAPSYPPDRIRARSAPVTVTWSPSTFTVTLEAEPTWARPGTTSTLTATLNKDVAGTAVRIGLFDMTSRQRLAECTTGTTCTAPVSSDVSTTRTYQAFVAESAATAPPPHVQASSSPVTVTWSLLPDPTRPPNIGGGDLSGTVAYRGLGVPPPSTECASTTFDVTATSVAAWVNGSGTAYAGPLAVVGEGAGECEKTTTGGGTIVLAASGNGATGTLSCPSLVGTFTRLGPDVTVIVNGDCTINGFAALRVGVVVKVSLIPANGAGALTEPMAAATLLGGFVVYPA